MRSAGAGYYGNDLALVHHAGFGFHADACAEGILDLLRPVRERAGAVLELGCGSGALTRHLVEAGHRVIATDASPAMLELARTVVAGAEDIRHLVLPHDDLPMVDAVVSVGHVLSYLPDEAAVERSLRAMAAALLPGGVLAIDLCDLRWAEARSEQPGTGRVGDGWAVITELSVPTPRRCVREITTFVRTVDETWRRSRERHTYVLVSASQVQRVLSQQGVDTTVSPCLGSYDLPQGLVAVTGERRRAHRSQRLGSRVTAHVTIESTRTRALSCWGPY